MSAYPIYVNSLAVGKTSNAYTVDIVGDINFTGTLRSNGVPFASATAASTGSVSMAPTYAELLTNNNTLAMTASNHTYTSTTFTTPSVATSAVVSYNGSGWVQGGGLFVVTATIGGVSRSTNVYNSGVSHMPVPALQFVVQLAASTTYTVTLTFSNNALTDTNDYHNLNVTMFPNAVASQTAAGQSTCQALWYTTSNVPSGNYVGTAAYGGTAIQNNCNLGQLPFSTSTGLFTCQFTGSYQCNFTSTTFVAQDSVQIYRNGSIISPGYQCYGNVNNSISVSASIYCNAGDTLGFYVATGTIMAGGANGTQGCSIAFMSAGNGGPLSTSLSNTVYLAAPSNLGLGGKSNAAYPLDVLGDINFSGILRSNGVALSLGGGSGSQFLTSSGSNIYLASGSNLALGGKSNAAYPLDVLGDINFTGILRSNGAALSLGGGSGSQFLTSSGSNIYLASGSNLALGGKSNAAYPLDVLGDINFSGILRSNGVAFSLGGGSSSQFQSNGANVYLPSGSNLGIGQSNPAYTLDIVGDVNVTGAFRVGGSNLGNLVGSVRQTAPITKIKGGSSHTIALSSIGQVYAWGDKSFLGNNSTTQLLVPVGPISITGSPTITAIACGVSHTIALSSTGQVYGWGESTWGQIGTGGSAFRYTPVAISITGSPTITAIACGGLQTFAVSSTGQVYAWGKNNQGQLGNNSTVDSYTPSAITITGTPTITAIATGYYHTIALSSTGQVYTWGNNSCGQLGNNSFTPSLTAVGPISITGTPTITAIACGGSHTLALSSTGQVYAWGLNNYGQLGNNSTATESKVPIAISITGTPTITAIAAGYYHTVALSSTGQVYAWGNNDNGRLGNNSITYSNIPVAISITGSPTITAIACGNNHTLAVSSTGQVYAWGENTTVGKLGNNSTTDSLIPVAITSGAFATVYTLFTNFTGQHRCFLSDIAEASQQNYQGLIACAAKNKYSDVQIANAPNNTYAISSVTSGIKAITINESLPVVSLCAKANDKSCFGVISMSKDNASSEEQLAIANLRNSQGDSRVEINAVGEGAIWVSDANGSLESGDYITTSAVTGYGQRQADDLHHNYTVAKITMDCDFNPAQVPQQQLCRDASGAIVTDEQGAMVWEPVKNDPAHAAYQQAMALWQSEPGQDPSTMPQYIPSPPEQWVQVMEPAYEMRYLAADGSQITAEAYNSAKAADANAPVYRAAFVGCTYHCG